jgi:holo-[acyl-carrier protein] synthase
MILAHGIDLVDIRSTERLLAASNGQFMTRYFTPQEQAAIGNGSERAARLSGRLAVKEAVMKALGTGFSEGVNFLSVEVSNLPSGAPIITLYGAALQKAEEMGIASWMVSTSHDGNTAIASVIGLSA